MSAPEQQLTWAGRVSNIALALVGAGLLGFVGVLLQAGHRAFGHMTFSDFWLMPLIAAGLWNMLAAEFNPAALREIVRYWPMLFPLFGVAALLVWNSGRRGAVHTSRTGGDHGRR